MKISQGFVAHASEQKEFTIRIIRPLIIKHLKRLLIISRVHQNFNQSNKKWERRYAILSAFLQVRNRLLIFPHMEKPFSMFDKMLLVY